MDSFYLTDKGEVYLQKALEKDFDSDTHSETVREIIILQIAKEDSIDQETLDFIQGTGLIKGTFRRLFEAGYIDRE